MHHKVKVLQKHIDSALPENSSRCMIAEGIKDSIPGAKKVHVDMQTMRYTDAKGIRRTALTPSACQAALVRFDAGDPVQPFTFNFPTPIHISKPTGQTRQHEAARLTRGETEDEPRRSGHFKARVGGKPVPTGRPSGRSTMRKFGIRGLRINQQGQAVQYSVIEGES